MKKIISFSLVCCLLVSLFSVSGLSASAATTAFDKLSTSKYAKVYTLSKTGKTIPCTSKYLSTRGSVTYGKSSTAYIANSTDEIYLCDVGQTNGKYWAYVSYPIGSKRAYAYISLSSITSNNSSHTARTSSGKFYCSYRKGISTSSSYYVAKNDTVYLIAISGSDYQIMYPITGNKWRIGWCSKTNYNKYCTKSGSTSSVSSGVSNASSGKISFDYSKTSSDYTYSNGVGLKVNGTKVSVGSTFYTYTGNGKYKTTGSYDGYTYAKVGSKYVNMNGWQCCAYARYIQYLMYGKQDFANSGSFKKVSAATGKKATASTIKSWINTAGVGAHIRSKRPHSLVVIKIDNNGFYYTDANADGKSTIRVGYYTWSGFASSNYKSIDKITYY